MENGLRISPEGVVSILTEIEGESTGQIMAIPEEDRPFLDSRDNDVRLGIGADEAGLGHQYRRIKRWSRRYFSRKRQYGGTREGGRRAEFEPQVLEDFDELAVAKQCRLREGLAGDGEGMLGDNDMALSRTEYDGMGGSDGSHERKVRPPSLAPDLQLVPETDQKDSAAINPQQHSARIGGGRGS